VRDIPLMPEYLQAWVLSPHWKLALGILAAILILVIGEIVGEKLGWKAGCSG